MCPSSKRLGMGRHYFLHGEKCYLFHGDLSLLQLLFSDPSLELSLSRIRLSVGPWSFIYQTFILLRLLDLWFPYAFFSHEILQLVHLRYLAILSDDAYMLPPSFSSLSNLETLILGTQQSDISIPHSVCKMVNLRHLYTKGRRYHIESCLFEAAGRIDGHASVLDNLQTISNLCLSGPVQDVLAGTPNLRKLGFSGDLVSDLGHLTFPDLDFLGHLETLKLHNTGLPIWSANLQHIKFPTNIKRLTLRGTMINWEEISGLGMLPNLEVLKLKYNACWGRLWVTPDNGRFRRLKFLKFEDVGIVRWIASGTLFPNLQHLVLKNCLGLEEIPFNLGDIVTLQMIEVTFCSRSIGKSASKIKKEQESMGNDWLKICVYL